MSFIQLGHWQVHDIAGRRKYLTVHERARFLEAAQRLRPDLRALCRVLAYTGCRVSEALSLTAAQLDAEGGRLILRTLKRRRVVYRAVPIPPGLIATLQALPIAIDGRLWHMHRSTAWRTVTAVMDQAGICGPMACCKGLRHGFGMAAAGAGVPPNLIAKWLGHASLETSAIYLDAVGLEEREFAERMW
jgi:integrase/recombinase XerD